MLKRLLAAFPDGRVHYINHSEKMSIFEGSPPEIESRIKDLIAASQPVLTRLNPWEKARLPPPAQDIVRLTFLVSDGLYFGQERYAEV